MKSGRIYKTLIISAALLAAPLAFADDGERSGMPPPPQQQGEMMHGYEDGGMMASTTVRMHRPPMWDRNGSTTPGRGWREGMGTTTKDMMDDGGESDHGTSTPEKTHGMRAFMSNLFNFFSSHHDNASSTPPHIGDAADLMASSSIDASTTPPRGVVGFFMHLFNFFH